MKDAVLSSKLGSMDPYHIPDPDKALVGQALRAAADGPFFPDWEFHTLFGLTRSEVRAVADLWPNVDFRSENVHLAVNNSLNNLWGYPHGQESVWSQWLSVDRSKLRELLDTWRGMPR